MLKRLLLLLLLAGAIVGGAAGIGWGVRRVIEATAAESTTEVPNTTVRKGGVTITVAARGTIQGGSSESLVVPMTGTPEVALTYLRQTGERVEPGDIVAEFDTTQQEFNLREAEADLAEAEQHVIQARAEAEAALEEARYQVIATEAEVKLAQQEIRKNELLPEIQQRQNEIALESAQNRYRQAQQDYDNRRDSAAAGVDIQEAAVNRARLQAEAARRNIENLTLRAKTGGFVQLLENRNSQLLYSGMVLPPFQTGDTARAGQGVAQIPDMSHWEVSARIPEADRGYLQAGQAVIVRPAAIPGRDLTGHITVLGGSTGYAYNRAFDCRVELDEIDPALRPGMTANIQITVESLDDVLWIPSQALFENDGRTFVYRRTESGYITHDVALVRRSESQAVITGIEEGEQVALARPGQPADSGAAKDGVLKALPQ